MKCIKKFVLLLGIILSLLILFEKNGRAEVSFPDSLDNLSISIDKGMISAGIREMPLHEVMRKLASLTEVKIYVNPLVREKKVSVIFDDLNLESAIRRLLKGTNYALLYNRKIDGADKYVDGTSISIYIVPSKSNFAFAESISKSEEKHPAYRKKAAQPLENLQKADNEQEASITEIDHGVLSMHERNDRIAGLQAQVSEHGQASLPLILASMMDPDLAVQEASMNLLLNDLREVVPSDILSQVVITSGNPNIRIDALRLLTDRQEENDITQGTLELALMDSDPIVQKEAHKMLVDLTANGTTAQNDTSSDLSPTHDNGGGMVNE